MPNQTKDKISYAQKLMDQCKDKEALEILENIENVNELSVDEQIRYYLLQSSLFYQLGQENNALDTADKVFQISMKTGNDLVTLDASIARGKALFRLGKTEECYNSILKIEDLISRIKNQPEKIIGKRKADLAFIKARYYWNIGEIDKSIEQNKFILAIFE